MGHLLTLLQSKKIIVKDSFNRADSALTMGNADTGQAWNPVFGTWGISGNKGYLATGSNGAHAVVDTGIANYRYQCSASGQLGATDTLSPRFAIRYIDGNNLLSVGVTSTAITVRKTVASVSTVLATISGTFADNTLYRIKIECIGATLNVYYLGALISSVTITDSVLLTGTKCGILASKAGAPTIPLYIDDLLVEAL